MISGLSSRNWLFLDDAAPRRVWRRPRGRCAGNNRITWRPAHRRPARASPATQAPYTYSYSNRNGYVYRFAGYEYGIGTAEDRRPTRSNTEVVNQGGLT